VILENRKTFAPTLVLLVSLVTVCAAVSLAPSVRAADVTVTVWLNDSSNTGLDGGVVQYYSGSWQSFGTTSGGKVSKELLPNNYAFRMDYGNARNEKWQNVGTNPTVVFQTVDVEVQLKDSTGAFIDTGTVSYYYWGWQSFGTTSGGKVSKELLPNNYAFRMDYGNARNEKWQNVGTNPTVVFQTVLVTVELRDHGGNLLNGGGTVSYYYWSWKTFGSGSTSGGQVSMELLPNNYCFRMDYNNARNEKWQNVGTNPTVVFQTGKVTLQFSGGIQYYYWSWNTFTKPSMELLPNAYYFRFNGYQTSLTVNAGDDIKLSFVVIKLLSSKGSGIAGGTAQYYNGGWKNIPGGTGSDGVLLYGIPGIVPSTYISMNYAYARQEKGPLNIASNSYVTFQTAKVTVELKDSTGAFITGGLGTVQYYSGGWRTFGSGTTDGGVVSMELLPVSYGFSMNYAHARQEKGPLAVSGTSYTVTFQTAKVTVELKDSTGAFITGGLGTVQYYSSGAWRTFGSGTTDGGVVSMELLPVSYCFSMNYAHARQEKGPLAVSGTSYTVTFQTGKVHSRTNTCTQYYAGAWRAFTQDMELLPGKYYFRFSDGTADTQYAIVAGTTNTIH